MKSKYVLPSKFKEMTKICFSAVKFIIVKCGEIWFPWRNMVLCSTYKFVLQNQFTFTAQVIEIDAKWTNETISVLIIHPGF